MVLPKELFKEALVAVYDGLVGGHLGRMKSLKKMKARFWRPGRARGVHPYCSVCLTCVKYKSRPNPRAPLRTRRGNRYILTVQYSFKK